MATRFRSRETGEEYYVRELPDGTLAWIGEHPGGRHDKPFVNVFLGRKVDATHAVGSLFDVPKGTEQAAFRDVHVTLSSTDWLLDLPDGTRRTLVPATSDFIVNTFGEWGCGFYDEPADSASTSLTGVWKCDDTATYYVRQHGSDVAWLGEHPDGAFTNVFLGTLQGTRLVGRWVDVPKGRHTGHGEIVLNASQSGLFAAFGPLTELRKLSESGGFGGARWFKTDSVRVALRLFDLRIERNADVGGINRGGDEPYLIPLAIVLGGNQYTDPVQLTSSTSSQRPLVLRALEQHPWGTRGDWPKNNLTWQEDLAPGTLVNVPEFISYVESELRTFKGLQPNTALARSTANFIPFVAAMEEASTRNADIRAGYAALVDNLAEQMHAAIVASLPSVITGTGASAEAILAGFRDALLRTVVEAIARSAVSDLFGILGALDPDKPMGLHTTPASFGALRDAALSGGTIPINASFTGGDGGRWRLRGIITGSRAPAHAARAATWRDLTQLEVTLMTGDGDKREGSLVELAVERNGAAPTPAVPAHALGQRFADGSFQVARVSLAPTGFGASGALHVKWTRDPSGGLRRPDTWKLSRVRVAGFDALHHRTVLLSDAAVETLFESNRTLRIPFTYT